MASQEELFNCIGEDVDVGDFLDEALKYECFQSPEEMERNRRTHQSELEFATESLLHPMMALGGGLLNQADGLRFFEKLLPHGYMVRLPRDMYGDCDLSSIPTCIAEFPRQTLFLLPPGTDTALLAKLEALASRLEFRCRINSNNHLVLLQSSLVKGLSGDVYHPHRTSKTPVKFGPPKVDFGSQPISWELRFAHNQLVNLQGMASEKGFTDKQRHAAFVDYVTTSVMMLPPGSVIYIPDNLDPETRAEILPMVIARGYTFGSITELRNRFPRAPLPSNVKPIVVASGYFPFLPMPSRDPPDGTTCQLEDVSDLAGKPIVSDQTSVATGGPLPVAPFRIPDRTHGTIGMLDRVGDDAESVFLLRHALEKRRAEHQRTLTFDEVFFCKGDGAVWADENKQMAEVIAKFESGEFGLQTSADEMVKILLKVSRAMAAERAQQEAEAAAAAAGIVDRQVGSEPDRTFHRFSELPAELNHKIWGYAIENLDARVVEIRAPDRENDKYRGQRSEEDGPTGVRRWQPVCKEVAPAMFFACKDSRFVLMKTHVFFKGSLAGAPSVVVDLGKDWLAMTDVRKGRCYHNSGEILDDIDTKIWKTIKNLAIDIGGWELEDAPSDFAGLDGHLEGLQLRNLAVFQASLLCDDGNITGLDLKQWAHKWERSFYSSSLRAQPRGPGPREFIKTMAKNNPNWKAPKLWGGNYENVTVRLAKEVRQREENEEQKRKKGDLPTSEYQLESMAYEKLYAIAAPPRERDNQARK